MPYSDSPLELEKVSQEGSAVYDTLKRRLEAENMGHIVAIHLASNDYVVAKTRLEAVRKLKTLQPNGPLYVSRIGPPTSSDLSVVDRMAGISK